MAFLFVSRNMIYAWVNDGAIGRVRYRERGPLRFRLEDLEDYVQAHHERGRRAKRVAPAGFGASGCEPSPDDASR